MEVMRRLKVEIEGEISTLEFGRVTTETEKEKVFALRYKKYVAKGYIDPELFPDGFEKDSFDEEGCEYFVCTLDDEVVGTVRFIQQEFLPTEELFDFPEPSAIAAMSRNKRAELGRLVIAPPQDGAFYLPRNLVLIFIIDILVEHCSDKGILGGYAFIKESLNKKMKKLSFPFHRIPSHSEHKCKPDNILYPYFTQKSDPVIPIYFITNEFKNYISKIIENSWVFYKEEERTYCVRKNLYTRFLKKANII